MRARGALAVLLAVPLLAGCSTGDPEPLPRDCLSSQRSVTRALAAAPGKVVLDGGTPLSTCVRLADQEGELQNVGSAYTGASSRLAERLPRSDAAALQLGYLVGATRRGAQRTGGLAAELVRRLEQAVGVEGPPAARRPPYVRGLMAGQRGG